MVRRDTAISTLVILFGSLAAVRACHDLAPAIPFSMGMAIVAAILTVALIAADSDGWRR